MVKAPPDILTVSVFEQPIGVKRHLRYRVFLLTTWSMGLRLSETLALEVADIDQSRGQALICWGKGHKQCYVPLPHLTYQGLPALWCKHRHPGLLYPNPTGKPVRFHAAKKQ